MLWADPSVMGCPVVCWVFHGIPGLHPPGAPSPSCDNQMSPDITRVPWGHSCAVENLWAACSAASSLPNPQVILSVRPTAEACRSLPALLRVDARVLPWCFLRGPRHPALPPAHCGCHSLCWSLNTPGTRHWVLGTAFLSAWQGPSLITFRSLVTCHLGMAFLDHPLKITHSRSPPTSSHSRIHRPVVP